MAAHLKGELALDEAIELMKRNTRRFAKRQLSWFRSDRRIRWIQAGAAKTQEEVAAEVLRLVSP
jgi:tRNA dimethylallyltransferase